MMKKYYASPDCELIRLTEAAFLLTGSDLTDDGAGDFLLPDDEYIL